MDLHLFDGAGAGTGAEGGQGVAGGTPTSTSVDAGSAPGERAKEEQDAAADRPSFEELIKGDYKAEADKYINGIVRGRLKESKNTITAQNEILSVVAAKYGMDLNDLSALKEKVSNDDTYYEERAAEEGLTVDQYRRISQAEAKGKAYDLMVEDQQREENARAQVAAWQEQAEQVKTSFPDFDLAAEMQNQTFQKLLASGVDMQSAYVSCHTAEILQGAMQYTASEVRKATANSIAARGTRPRENASSSQAAATMRNDPSKLTRAEREALSRRAMAGETITF